MGILTAIAAMARLSFSIWHDETQRGTSVTAKGPPSPPFELFGAPCQMNTTATITSPAPLGSEAL